MTRESLAAAFAQHGNWITRFVVDGVAYGGSFDAVTDPRLAQFWSAFPQSKTILELGSLEGGHTIGLALATGVQRVLGLEGRKQNLARARFAAELMKAGKAQFAQADLETADLKQLGKFDAVFCSGLLYHLPEPWKLIQQFPSVSQHLFLWTHYCHDEQADTAVSGFHGRVQSEGGTDEPLSGLSPQSFWPTLGSLVKMLTVAGFGTVHILHNDITHPDGPAVTIAAFAGVSAKLQPAKKQSWWRR